MSAAASRLAEAARAIIRPGLNVLDAERLVELRHALAAYDSVVGGVPSPSAIDRLPTDAIAQVVRAYTDAWDDAESTSMLGAPHEAASRAFRDALSSVLPGLTVERLAALAAQFIAAREETRVVATWEAQSVRDFAMWLLGRLQGDQK